MTRLWPMGEIITVWGPEENPSAFDWHGEHHCIEELCNRWRVHTRWWDQNGTIQREYLKVVTDTGLLCLLCHDLAALTTSPGAQWFMARLYD